MEWREVTDVMRNKKMSVHLVPECKIFRIVIHLPLSYGSEFWPSTKDVQTIHVIEMHMLRWTAGVTRMERVINSGVRNKFGVIPIQSKILERLNVVYKVKIKKI